MLVNKGLLLWPCCDCSSGAALPNVSCPNQLDALMARDPHPCRSKQAQ